MLRGLRCHGRGLSLFPRSIHLFIKFRAQHKVKLYLKIYLEFFFYELEVGSESRSSHACGSSPFTRSDPELCFQVSSKVTKRPSSMLFANISLYF